MKIPINKEWMIDYVQKVSVSYRYKDRLILESECNSIDVNDHIEEVVNKILDLNEMVYPGGMIEIYYVGKRMFIGDGPSISAKSVKLISSIDAEIGQDIYCICK